MNKHLHLFYVVNKRPGKMAKTLKMERTIRTGRTPATVIMEFLLKENLKLLVQPARTLNSTTSRSLLLRNLRGQPVQSNP